MDKPGNFSGLGSKLRCSGKNSRCLIAIQEHGGEFHRAGEIRIFLGNFQDFLPDYYCTSQTIIPPHTPSPHQSSTNVSAFLSPTLTTCTRLCYHDNHLLKIYIFFCLETVSRKRYRNSTEKSRIYFSRRPHSLSQLS